MNESSNRNTESIDFWELMAKEAYRLNMDPTDLGSIMQKDSLTLMDLKKALDQIVSPEVLIEHAQDIHKFYSEHCLWGEIPEKVSLDHKVVIPFPEIKGLATPELTLKIFKERTKFLMRLVASSLKNQEYHNLNWWYLVKTMFPEMDNQVLVQFKPEGQVSFFPKMGSIRIGWEDLLSRRRGFTSAYSRIALAIKDLSSAPPEALTTFKIFVRFFNPWPLRKRMRILSQISFPFNQEVEDTIAMFMSIPESEWNEEYFKQNPGFKKRVSSLVEFRDIHDLVLITVRKKTNPLKNMDQSSLYFLEKEVFEEGYSIRVPKSNHDLDLISSRLNNCVGRAGYFDKVVSGQVFILEVIKDKASYACLEFDRRSNCFIQKKMDRNQEFKDVGFIKELERRINKSSSSWFTKIIKLIKGK